MWIYGGIIGLTSMLQEAMPASKNFARAFGVPSEIKRKIPLGAKILHGATHATTDLVQLGAHFR